MWHCFHLCIRRGDLDFLLLETVKPQVTFLVANEIRPSNDFSTKRLIIYFGVAYVLCVTCHAAPLTITSILFLTLVVKTTPIVYAPIYVRWALLYFLEGSYVLQIHSQLAVLYFSGSEYSRDSRRSRDAHELLYLAWKCESMATSSCATLNATGHGTAKSCLQHVP